MRFRAHASASSGNLCSVQGRKGTLLIECGLSLGRIRRALGFLLSEVQGCLVTHHHGDHACSAEALLLCAIDVYASAATWAALGTGQHHRAQVVVALEAFVVGEFRVLPFDVRHDAEGALGYMVEDGGGDRLLFACDTAYVPYTFTGLTHIAVECNYSAELLRAHNADPARAARVLRYHMGLERVLALLAANDLTAVREITLLHLSDRHGDGPAFKRAIEQATGKPVRVAPRRERRRGDEAK